MATSNADAQELALKIARTIARAGCDRITDPFVEKFLLKSTFFKDYGEAIVTSAKKVNFDLSMFAADSKDIRFFEFFPLPFSKKGAYLIAFFRPTFFKDNGCKVDIIQLSWPNQDAALGYRIECGPRGLSDTHGYLHVQITPSFPYENGSIGVSMPPMMSKEYPAFPIPHKQVYASLYGALVAFAGLQRDWQGGLVDEFEKCRDFYDGADFDDVLSKLKGVCEELYF